MRKLLLLLMIHGSLRSGESLNGVIWDKWTKNFVPIFNVPNFAKVHQEVLKQSREQETHNFQGKIVRVSFFEETNIINSCANGTRITGAIGEIWNTLSELLNFTLKPVYMNKNTMGLLNSHGKYSGLMGTIQRNETDVIPRIEAHNKRLQAAQFTIPLWKTKFRLYIRREVKHNNYWMLKLFSRRVWYSILWMYVLLTICSYLSHALNTIVVQKKSKAGLHDHFFYNFGILCGECYVPENLSTRSRGVEFWIAVFSFLIRTAFGALLIGYMTQIITKPPFHDLNSLVHDTSYTIVTLHGTLPDIVLKIDSTPALRTVIQTKRNLTVYSTDELYRKACTKRKLNAIFEGEEIKKAKGKYICALNPTDIVMWETWIVSGISWSFEYKRSLDIGLIKLREVGFITLLKHHWIEKKNMEEVPPNIMEPIIMDQVILILLVFCTGLLLSFVILVLENVMFYCNN